MNVEEAMKIIVKVGDEVEIFYRTNEEKCGYKQIICSQSQRASWSIYKEKEVESIEVNDNGNVCLNLIDEDI